MKKQPTERKSGAPVRCSDLVRPSSFYQKLLGTLTWLNPMKYYQSWQNSRAWNRYYKWYAETEQYRSEAKLRRAQEQSDLANQTARVRLRSCIEFASGQKMELKDVEVDIPFPYFNGARWPKRLAPGTAPRARATTHKAMKPETDLSNTTGAVAQQRLVRSGCPCCYTTPCSKSCTCANPFLSGGCRRCARYGGPEQQRQAAEHLARIIDSANDQAHRLVPTSETERKGGIQ
jgi:hypothetical protein